MTSQAQADEGAEHMRKLLEEKQQERGWPEEARRQWVDPGEPPVIAQQFGATGIVREGNQPINPSRL